MKKPTYYLWRDDYSTLEEYTNTRERYTRMGFRVVTFKDGQSDKRQSFIATYILYKNRTRNALAALLVLFEYAQLFIRKSSTSS